MLLLRMLPLCVQRSSPKTRSRVFRDRTPCISSAFCLELLTFCCCCFVGCAFVLRVRGAYYTQVRDGFKHKYGLPDDEFCFSYTATTYMCWCTTYTCTECAAYQMAYFMKYDAPNKQDLECCCYKAICLPMCGPSED